jgi:uncharacterized membrane protein YjgN (DUF898 family)
MSAGQGGAERDAHVVFSGTRPEFAAILLRGYLLLVPTIGLYRFWLTNWRRRFYWSHTTIGGDALEYTGNASQLLLGFLMALAVFVPLYGLFFFLSTQSSEAAIVGYGGIAVFVWFLAGYATYRARDFRLSRTLWRGIRFDQAGSAWGYAFRRFGWSLLMIITLGLVYPFMAANLWRYRFQHSWYGNRQFSFDGSWKQIAWPYYLSYFIIVAVGGTGLLTGAGMGVFPTDNSPFNPAGLPPVIIAAALCGVMVLFYKSRELTRMFSSVRLGQSSLKLQVQARSLLRLYLLFGLGLAGAYLVLLIGGVIVLGAVAGEAFAGGTMDTSIFLDDLRSSFVTVLAVVAGYLLVLGAFSFMRELFVSLGFWRLLARNAVVSGVDSLHDVKARAEDKSLAGEGLADALNVGAY